MPQFSIEKLKTTQYLATSRPISGPGVVIPIPPARPRTTRTLTSSEFTARIRNVGVSSNAYDITTGTTIGLPDPNVELGVLYSNGYRYQYLDFKGTEAGGCQIIVPEKTVSIQTEDENGVVTIEEVTIESSVLITAYVGNAVYPQLPPNNVSTISLPFPGKVPAEFPNKNC